MRKNYRLLLSIALLSTFIPCFADLIPADVLAAVHPQSYTLGGVNLVQIPVFDQMKEAQNNEANAQGCTSHSCVYHALRNGLIGARAMKDPHNAPQILGELYNRADMYDKLRFDGTWRQEILKSRHGTGTENLNAAEMNRLITYEKQHGALKGTDILVGIFENPNYVKLNDATFVGCLDGEAAQMKQKIKNKEDFVGIMMTFVETHDSEVPDRRKPDEQNTPGHWIAVVVSNVKDKRQYLLLDSADQLSRFTESILVKQLLEYLEGRDTPPATLDPCIVLNKSNNPLWQTYAQFLGVKLDDQRMEQQENLSFIEKHRSLLYGIASGIGLYVAYTLYLRTAANKQAPPESTIRT